MDTHALVGTVSSRVSMSLDRMGLAGTSGVPPVMVHGMCIVSLIIASVTLFQRKSS